MLYEKKNVSLTIGITIHMDTCSHTEEDMVIENN